MKPRARRILPRYAFPTDVVSFYVFDRDRSTPFRAEFQYEPSEGLPVALTQYAPGKVVWIDNKEWTSGALYAPVQKERFDAWRGRLLYFECKVCHYAEPPALQRGQPRRGARLPGVRCRGEVRPGDELAPAAGVRPPGLEGSRHQPHDAPARSYATRAKLMAPGPTEESAWERVTDRLEETYRRETLLVTNTGPRGEGYSYCTRCGLIEPTKGGSGDVTGVHPKPYPDEKEPACPGSASTRGLVLGTDFISDVLLVRLKVDPPATLQPQYLTTHIALRSVAEATTIASAHLLDIEATELQAEYRPALTPGPPGVGVGDIPVRHPRRRGRPWRRTVAASRRAERRAHRRAMGLMHRLELVHRNWPRSSGPYPQQAEGLQHRPGRQASYQSRSSADRQS